MAKYYGAIGFVNTVETAPGVYEEQITERNYYGDIGRNSRSLQNADQLNDNVDIANEISIVADPFVNENIFAIRYVKFAGAKWKVKTAEVRYPRLSLTLGGLYNG